ncbi:MAG: ABC transporter permease [Gammaproteobacteria bacterium]|jgi:ABC-type lipoprotein release transport system permease subunit|nr:ABC transporter permease [Gammaproteobacteria bacterium]MBT4491760.1 ABC transporter permease [Gammaproteobacteria bacterium]MBT7370867.1 ABC transporter permease [Gammaproteobacteria bacterium]
MLSLKLAWRNLFRNTRRTVLTCLLISSALIVLILVDGLIIGMTDVMVGGITQTLEGEGQINRKGFRDNYEVEYVIDDPESILKELEATDYIAGFGPRVLVGGMIASPYNTTGGLVYGVDAEKEIGVSKISDAVYEGHYLTGTDREILIGKHMADLLEIKLGDRIIITAATVDTNDISQELFRASGFFEFGPEELDENLVFINLSQAQRFLGMEGRLHQIALRFEDPEDAKNRDLPIFKKLTNDSVEALGWLDLQPSIGAMIEMTNYTTAIVGLVLFLLTSLGVINSMFMSIYERIYEFGVAKAIGTTPRQIVQLVMFEALLLAVISCFAGLILGYLSSDYFSEYGIPMGKMEFSGVVLDGNIYTKLVAYQFIAFPIYVTLLTVVAAIYPAVFAARIVPTQALQRAL